jgi:long-chain acyl-CoA synthetase
MGGGPSTREIDISSTGSGRRPGRPYARLASVQEVRNIADLVRRAADTRPDHPALRWHDRVLTWAEVDQRVDDLAAALAALDLPGGGDHAPRVAIGLPNVPEFAIATFAAMRANLVAVPVNPGYTARELAHLLSDSGAAVLIASQDVVAETGEHAPRHTFTLGELPQGGGPVPPPTAGGEDIAVLLYTSGTAGAPKGAMLSHRALLANHDQLAALPSPPAGPDDVLLLALPLFHAYGLNSGLVATAYHAATGVLVERFDPADALDLIARHGVTVVAGVPPMYIAWSLMGERLAVAFKSVRLAVSGTAPLEPATADRFAAASGQPVHEGYGLTETAPVVSSTIGSPTLKPGSIGRPIPGVEVKLALAGGGEVVVDGPLDDDDYDDDSPGTPGTDPGEVLVRGANLFSGYWPDGRDGPGPDGWWHTADVAYADADGDLFLVDRLSELILVSGFNVYPIEVEQVLMAHPAVTEAAVLGVPHPYTGQTVKAFVVRSGEVTADELVAYAEKNLARFKCPTAIEFVAELPHSATGKVRKGVLRDGT